MNSVLIHVHDSLNDRQLREVRAALMALPYVSDVEISPGDTQNLTVEYEEHHDVPMALVRALEKRGLHPDIAP
jgi:hypothetical protein